jgi:hypothetical protein
MERVLTEEELIIKKKLLKMKLEGFMMMVEATKLLKQENKRLIVQNNGNKSRNPNFPEDISEFLVYQALLRKGIKAWHIEVKSGDMQQEGETRKLKAEVKGSASDGPTSFGPDQVWDILYFVKIHDYLTYTIYKINATKEHVLFKTMKVNANETLADQAKQKRRPRLTLDGAEMMKRYPDVVEILYEGNLLNDLSVDEQK